MSDNVLYRIFDDADDLLYVGITMSPINRFRDHRKTSWWPEAATIRMEHYSNRQLLEAAERLAIQTESPRCNIVLNGLPRQKTYSLEESASIICGDSSDKSIRWLLRQIKRGRALSRHRHGQYRMSTSDIEDLMDKCSNQPGLSDWVLVEYENTGSA